MGKQTINSVGLLLILCQSIPYFPTSRVAEAIVAKATTQ
jgi:hypothetical protein